MSDDWLTFDYMPPESQNTSIVDRFKDQQYQLDDLSRRTMIGSVRPFYTRVSRDNFTLPASNTTILTAKVDIPEEARFVQVEAAASLEVTKYVDYNKKYPNNNTYPPQGRISVEKIDYSPVTGIMFSNTQVGDKKYAFRYNIQTQDCINHFDADKNTVEATFKTWRRDDDGAGDYSTYKDRAKSWLWLSGLIIY